MKRYGISAKLTACILAAGLMLGGCGAAGGNKNVNAPGETKEQAAVTETGAVSEAAETADASALEPVTLTWYFWYGKKPPENEMVYDEINKYLKDKINTTINFQGMTRDDYVQKVPIMMQSGQDYDICFTAGNLNQYLPNVAQGAFAPLNDLLDQYGKDVKELIPEALWQAVTVNQEIYGVPIYKEVGHQLGFFVDQQIADECGIDLSQIKNWKDMEKAFYIVHEKMPDIIAYSVGDDGDDVSLPIEHVTGDWDLPAVLNVPWLNTYASAGDKVFNPYEQPEFKEYVEAAHKWWKDGISPKDPVKFRDKQDDEIKAGHVFAVNMWTAPNYDKVFSEQMGRTYTWVPMFDPIFEGSDAFGGLMAINAKSANKERAMMFLNLLNTDKTLGTLMKHGIEGRHYELVNDGRQLDHTKAPGYKAGEVEPYNQMTAWQYMTVFNQIWDVSYPEDIEQIYMDYNNAAKPSPNLGFTYDNSAMQNQIAAIQNTLKEYKDGLIYGIADPDTYLPEFLAKLKANGSDELIADVQQQLDAWRAENK